MRRRRVAGRAAHASAARPWHNGSVRLVTFNVKHGELGGVPRLAAALRDARADVIGLQEVDVGCGRSGCADQPSELGTALHMASCFAPALQLDGGAYGNALLARPELLDGAPMHGTVVPLPGGRTIGEEPRVVLAAHLSRLRVFVAHFDLPAPVRQAQADALLAVIGDPRDTVVLGDFNEGADGIAVGKLIAAGFRDAWTEVRSDEVVTAPWDRPQARIDLVLLGPGVPRARSAEALRTDASDHALVVVEL
jgi:endonuclease/exonuclease/phosphatase family metal-dependent hydrolase